VLAAETIQRRMENEKERKKKLTRSNAEWRGRDLITKIMPGGTKENYEIRVIYVPAAIPTQHHPNTYMPKALVFGPTYAGNVPECKQNEVI
jgi:hypothetical protein